MKQKKQVTAWYIAVTHYLTTGIINLVITFAANWLLVFLFSPVLGDIEGKNKLLFIVMGNIVWFFGIWIGVLYSSRFIAKTYIVTIREKIIFLSTIYLIVIGVALRIFVFLSNSKEALIVYIIDYISFVIVIFLFYFFSKKYIKNSENAFDKIVQ